MERTATRSKRLPQRSDDVQHGQIYEKDPFKPYLRRMEWALLLAALALGLTIYFIVDAGG